MDLSEFVRTAIRNELGENDTRQYELKDAECPDCGGGLEYVENPHVRINGHHMNRVGQFARCRNCDELHEYPDVLNVA